MKKNSFATTYNPLSNQQATYNPLSNQQAKTPTTLELIKMVAELAAIDHASSAGLYSPIPINANFNVNIGDLNISCSIINNAARDIDKKQATTQQESSKATSTTTSNQQQQKPQKQATTQQESSKATSTTTSNQQQQKPQQQTTTHQYDMFRQLPEKYHKLYGVITDYLGSYTKIKICITPTVTRDAVKIAFINKGVSTAATNYPFFGVESIKDQRYFEKNFKAFGVYPNGDAFYIAVSIDEEMHLNRFIQMVKEHIYKNKRAVVWRRYNY